MRSKNFRKKRSDYSLKSFWRIIWYSVLIWILTIVTSGFVFLPWFYLAFALLIIGTTAYYFRKVEKTLLNGLWVSISWFFTIVILDFFEVVAFNFADNVLYVSDVRNWLRYALILLTPVIYTLIFESVIYKRRVSTGTAPIGPEISIDFS